MECSLNLSVKIVLMQYVFIKHTSRRQNYRKHKYKDILPTNHISDKQTHLLFDQ